MDQSIKPIDVLARSDGILHLVLNRPQQLNALNHNLLKDLSTHLVNAKQDNGIKAVLLSGAGKAFCAGADIKQLADLNGVKGLEFARFGQAVFRQLETLGKPSLAAIHGYAFGGGLELAMACTIRIAGKDAKFAQPEIKLGVIPGFGGTQRLTRLAGKGRAMELCLTGRRFGASDAYAYGVVSEVIDEAQLSERAIEILSELVKQSPIAMQSIMTVINQGSDLPLEDALELEAVHFSLCCTTNDKDEGVTAFLEKRAAVFQGA